MKRRKIIYIISDQQFGGGSRHLFNLITHLDKKKFQLILISRPSPIVRMLENRSKVYLVEMKKRIDFKAIKKIKKIILGEQPDLIHLHSTRAGILGAIAAKNSKIPVVYTEHLFTREYQPQNKIIHFLQLKAFRRLSNRINKVIAVSKAVKDYFIEEKVFPASKIEVIYNGIRIDQSTVPGLAPRSGAGDRRPSTEIIMGSIGTLTKLKGYDRLVKAAQDIEGIKLEIIGSGEELDKLRKLDKNKKVKFLGQVKNSTKVISNWDIYVQPSLAEAFGLAVAEAMSVGLPVIASKVGGMPELVGESGILVKPGDERALARAIIKLRNDQNLRSKLGQKAAERITIYFSLEKMIRQTERLYEKVI